jgi:hypothetical protein
VQGTSCRIEGGSRGTEALRGAALDFGLQPPGQRLGRKFKVVIALHVQPELWRRVEAARPAQRGVAGDCAALGDDCLDAGDGTLRSFDRR